MGIYGKAIFVKVRYINTLTISLYPIYIHKVFPVTPQRSQKVSQKRVAATQLFFFIWHQCYGSHMVQLCRYL